MAYVRSRLLMIVLAALATQLTAQSARADESIFAMLSFKHFGNVCARLYENGRGGYTYETVPDRGGPIDSFVSAMGYPRRYDMSNCQVGVDERYDLADGRCDLQRRFREYTHERGIAVEWWTVEAGVSRSHCQDTKTSWLEPGVSDESDRTERPEYVQDHSSRRIGTQRGI